MPILVTSSRKEVEEGVVDGIEIRPVLEGIVEALGRDLRKLAGSDEARGREGVDGGGVAFPVGLGRGGGAVAGEVGAVVEEALVGAVPGVGFYWEGVGGVGGAFVVPVDLGGVSLHV